MASTTLRMPLTQRDRRRINVLMKRHNIGSTTALLRAALHAYAVHSGVIKGPSPKVKRALAALAMQAGKQKVPSHAKRKAPARPRRSMK